LKTEKEIDLNDELNLFRSFVQVRSDFVLVELVGPDIILLKPFILSKNNEIRPRIGFLALVHGNETIGLPILNTLMSAILSGEVCLYSETYFSLGNVAAAQEKKRFTEKDLNRCFGLNLFETSEDKRARELENLMLNKIDILLDLHQTVYASETPFFIFQYNSSKCYDFLSLMNVKIPTVLQFDNIGEDQGLSSDEYLRSRGGFGAALELGQVGYVEKFFFEGIESCLRLISKVKNIKNLKSISLGNPFQILNCEFYEIVDRQFAQHDNTVLDSKYFNFSKFEIGHVLGTSSCQIIKSDRSGRMLFPKLNQSVNKGQNLFFICKEVEKDKLNDLFNRLDEISL
jgi:succinylglutamate desuccinylase